MYLKESNPNNAKRGLKYFISLKTTTMTKHGGEGRAVNGCDVTCLKNTATVRWGREVVGKVVGREGMGGSYVYVVSLEALEDFPVFIIKKSDRPES